MRFVGLGNRLRSSPLTRQIRSGWTTDDLIGFDGELVFDDSPIKLSGTARADGAMLAALQEMTGIGRICLLYETAAESEAGPVHCVGLVAGRVMSLRGGANGACDIVFQPCVLTARTAVLNDDAATGKLCENRYIYKLQLTQ